MSIVKYVGKLSKPINRKLLHTHDFWEIVRYTMGDGKTEIGDQTHSFSAGDVIIVPPNVPHTDYALHGFQNYHCEFEDDAFPFDEPVLFCDSETDTILNLLTIMFNEYQLKGENYHELLDSLYATLVQYILTLVGKKQRNHPFVDYAISQIIENYSDPFYDFSATLPEIPFHPDYFRKLFFKDIGCTPAQYLTRQRIENAKKLLAFRKQSKLSIQEISWLSGFRDNLYFSRVFRENVGISPSEYYNIKQKKI